MQPHTKFVGSNLIVVRLDFFSVLQYKTKKKVNREIYRYIESTFLLKKKVQNPLKNI